MRSTPMKVLVTGSAGHLGEALMRTLPQDYIEVIGLDILASAFTTVVGSITDRDCVRECMIGVNAVLHTATLHKPHVATHRRQAFIDTNVTGTLVLLEEATAAGVDAFIFSSTTSVFGEALRPPTGHPAVWVTEDVNPVSKNIYGVTKMAAEELCQLFHQQHGLASIVLRLSRFFPEADDNVAIRHAYDDRNVKANEFLFRRVDIADAAHAHLLAVDKAASIGFDRLIISATTPFLPEDVQELRDDAPAVVARRVAGYAEVYQRLGWRMFPSIERVYVNHKAQHVLDWHPRYDVQHVLACLQTGNDPRSPLACAIGSKGYHEDVFTDGPYPVE